MTIDDLQGTLRARLDRLAAEHGVVGASMAVQKGDTVVEAATGLTNLRTGVEVTTDTVFQIGSISKSYTATLVMQLVDEGLIDLDAPVSRYLPDFRTTDPEAAASVTVRRLLSHTSGMDGDVFDDFGRGDECVERYVAAMAGIAHTHPVGAFFSYCNSGYVLLGRLIEHFRQATWDAALRQHLLGPLGAEDTVTLADEAILRRAAVGHIPSGEDGALQVAPMWFFGRAMGPAGVITAPAREVLVLARMHLDDGRASDGTQLLSPGAVKAMRQLEVEIPDPYVLGDGWGLGWILYRSGSPLVFGHDGTTVGQNAYLRIVPDADLAVCLLTNGGGAGALFDALVRPLLVELAGAELNPPPQLPPAPVEVDRTAFVGTYERSGVSIEVSLDEDNRIWIQARSTGPLAGTVPPEPPKELVPLTDSLLITAEPDKRVGRHGSFKFLEPGPAGFGYIHSGARATPRVSG
ncbi:MAG TPA: serine hydrolase domain-containing protein [Acidimicrobiales bacterium]|nr:serine hydrolase domain-containing protein [Acidimicrobiales bacterium]